MVVLGISAYYHDSAAALVVNGDIVAAAQEERFTRKKHDPAFPREAIEFCLSHCGFEGDEIDEIVFYDKPFLKFERLLETHYAFSPKGLKTFLKSMPIWLKEKLFLRDIIKSELKDMGIHAKTIRFSEHHLSHAASAFYPSPFEEAAILTVDGVGEWATTTISKGSGSDIEILKEMHFPHSWGLLYSAFTYYLGFRVNSGEYKLMGLAPYGDPNSEQTKEYIGLIKDKLIELREDGSLWLDLSYFDYSVGSTMTIDSKWQKLFGLERRKPEAEILQSHMNLAFAIQKVTEEGVLKLGEEAARVTQSKNLTLAGGVALNCVANGILKRSGIFENIWIQPAAGDAGGAVGAALAYWYMSHKSRVPKLPDSMAGSYLGPSYDDSSIERAQRKHKLKGERFGSIEDICKATADKIAEGNIVGWMQGRMEWGPRALGNRSILADPRNKEMQKKLNLKIKYRESFRPFAPSVIESEVSNYFDYEGTSPYMLMVADIKDDMRNPLPEDYHTQSLKDKLYHSRSSLPSITHLDYSARLQTVSEETNPAYFRLLNEFQKNSDFPVLINTSFNVRGEPIVCTPEDAMRCFLRTEMDILVVGQYMFTKSQQDSKLIEKNDDWKSEFPLD